MESTQRSHNSGRLIPWLAALVAALVFGGFLFAGLQMRSPAFRTLSFLREGNVQTAQTSLDPARTVLPNGDHAYEMDLVMAADSLIEQASAVQLRLLTGYPDDLPLVSATLDEIGGGLTFRAVEPARLKHYKHRRRVHLRFERTGPVTVQSPQERRFHMKVILAKEINAAVQLIAAYRPSVTNPAACVDFSRAWMPRHPLPAPTNEPPRMVAPIPMGQVVLPLRGPMAPRAELLAFLWELPGPGSIRWLAALAALAVASGVALVAASSAAVPHGLSAARLGSGTGLVFAGITLGQALCAPPLSGHDEQEHLLSYMRAAGHTNVVAELTTFTRRNHWDRTWLDASEKFSPDDRLEPYRAVHQEWASSGLAMNERSGLASQLWQRLGWLVVAEHPGRTLLNARILQTLLAALAVGGAATLLALGVGDASARAFASLGLLMVPTLPYLAMSLSNYGLVVCAAVVLAGAVGAGPLPARWEWLRALGFGLALGLALQSSRNMISLLGMLPMLVYRFVRRPHCERKLPAIVGFWIVLGAAGFLPSLLSTAEYAREIRAVFARFLPLELQRLAFAFPVGFWIAFLSLLGIGLEVLIQKGGKSRSRQKPVEPPSPTGFLARLPAVLAAAWFLWFTFLPGPPSDTASSVRSPVRHLLHNFHAFWSSFAAGHHDFDLSQTFWNALDWLYVTLPDSLFDLLVGSFALGLVLGLRRLGTRPPVRWVFWVGVTAGWSGCFALLLLASRQQGEPLIGRYLVVCYTMLLPVCSRGWLPGLARLARWNAVTGTVLLATAATALNGFALQLLLNRYF